MDSQLSRDEEEVVKFEESRAVLDKLLTFLSSFVAFDASDSGEAFSKEHPILMISIFSMVMIFFLTWLAATMLLRRRVEPLPMILVWIVLVTGSISSVLILIIISLPIALFASLLWVGIISSIAYLYCHELFFCSVWNAMAILMESYPRQSTRFTV